MDPIDVLNEDLEGKLEKHRDGLAESTRYLDVFVQEVERILTSLGPKASRHEMYRKRCKALGHINRSKLSPTMRAQRLEKLVSKYPVPYASTLEVKEDLFSSFRDARELVESLPFSVSRISVHVNEWFQYERQKKRPKQLLVNDALRLVQTVLFAD